MYFDLCRVMQNLVLHGQLHHIGQLEAVRAEELDAVVLPGIVRGGDDHARLKSMCVGQEGHRRGGNNARALDAHTCLTQPRGQRGRDPLARFARVAAQDHLGFSSNLAQRVAQRQPAGKYGVCVKRKFAGNGANAVGAEEFACVGCGHRLIS